MSISTTSQTSTLKIVILGELDESVLLRLKEKYCINVIKHKNDSDTILPRVLQTADVIIVRSPYKITRETIAAASHLRWIVRAGSGLDNIDLSAAKERNILIHQTPAAASSVAELGFGLLLGVARKIPALDTSMRKGEWQKFDTKGFELQGKTVLIVGFGRIGQKVARIASGFEMNVLVADRSPELLTKRKAIEDIPSARFVSLNRGLPLAEVLFLCCSLNETTRRIINAQRLSVLPKGAFLINVARGEVIEPTALYQALVAEHLGGVGLDTHEQEPPDVSPLLLHPRVVTTPHVGAQTSAVLHRIGLKVEQFIQNEVYPNWQTMQNREAGE